MVVFCSFLLACLCSIFSVKIYQTAKWHNGLEYYKERFYCFENLAVTFPFRLQTNQPGMFAFMNLIVQCAEKV